MNIQRNTYIVTKMLLVLITGAALAPAAKAQWTVTNLHPAASAYSWGFAVAADQQVGMSYVGGTRRASLWSEPGATWTSLHPTGSYWSEAFGTNGEQQVGFAYLNIDFPGRTRACLWNGTAASFVDLSPDGSGYSAAYDVDAGSQVGYANVGSVDRASLWIGTKESWTSLHPVGSNHSIAYGIHGNHQVGYARISGVFRAGRWEGSAASWVDLHPIGATESVAYGVHSGQQAGYARVGGIYRASLWSGTAGTWVDLNPAGSTDSRAYATHNGEQVGSANVGGIRRASFWSGTAGSWVDLSAYLPAGFTSSIANDIWHEGPFTYVVGSGLNSITGRNEALKWVWQSPDSDLDGLSDHEETTVYLTNPNNPDTDGDGLLDGTEVDMAQGGGCPNPLDPDSDSDGLSDGHEVALGTSACSPDTDGDGINDGLDPTPLVPGATNSWIEAQIRALAAETLATALSCFDAPNNNARKGRRNALSNMLTSAANLVADGDRFGAIDLLNNDVLQKLDGLPSPPDWLVNCPERDALNVDVQLILFLLNLP